MVGDGQSQVTSLGDSALLICCPVHGDRIIVGHEVHEQESGELAAELLQKTLLRENCQGKAIVLHSDNGAAMKAQ
ncbi:MAG: hypothetical protein ACRCZA_11920, partial [Shewanella sp.]|uniref:hypothetical protein n=1 Tax=Shewanella sp. TaxID=50422 RepID=UPI003F2D6671